MSMHNDCVTVRTKAGSNITPTNGRSFSFKKWNQPFLFYPHSICTSIENTNQSEFDSAQSPKLLWVIPTYNIVNITTQHLDQPWFKQVNYFNK